ncbi:hypothetical protein MASR2M29_15410 [Spirochaetota bacterium]
MSEDGKQNNEATQELEKSLFGKKVFFLNPPAVIEDVASALSDAEYEVYLTRDHAKLARYLHKEPDCLIFINIDEGNDEQLWRKWILDIRKELTSKKPLFGIISMIDDKDKKAFYLMEMGVECGFIVIKLGVAKTTEIVLKMLEANEAKGRRRYVRASCPPDGTEFSCKADEAVYKGWIRDISSVGMSVFFTGTSSPKAGSRLKDIQLVLKGVRIMLNGVVIGSHMTQGIGQITILMFEPASLNDDKKLRIRTFIRKTLQSNMDKALDLA